MSEIPVEPPVMGSREWLLTVWEGIDRIPDGMRYREAWFSSDLIDDFAQIIMILTNPDTADNQITLTREDIRDYFELDDIIEAWNKSMGDEYGLVSYWSDDSNTAVLISRINPE